MAAFQRQFKDAAVVLVHTQVVHPPVGGSLAPEAVEPADVLQVAHVDSNPHFQMPRLKVLHYRPLEEPVRRVR